ncbi:hypothetical protein [Sagittula sp. S175]|uniref:hypothetical protein n=1 Tax=Sagittula sp. S175 TaxID=3415129 RepID=UPI003C7A9BC6
MPLPLPPIPDGGGYLIDALLALGPTRSEPMGGARPTDWPEIAPFMQATRRITEPWEAEVLRDMCEAFCAGLSAGESPFADYPWDG